MKNRIDFARFSKGLIAVRDRWAHAKPVCGIVLGSGWDAATADFNALDELPYNRIPGLGVAGVEGHAGKLVLAKQNGSEVLIFKGRRHWYEGEGWTPITLPIYILHGMGAKTVLLTNAAGGIGSDLEPGMLMAIEDHINMLGGNPLIGPHRPELGPRFPDQSKVYSRRLEELLLDSGADKSGVYLATGGPSFETPAEIRAFRALGASAVGMSTVPEAILANTLGMEVAGLSCISNLAAGVSATPLSHAEVSQTAQKTLPKMRSLLNKFIKGLDHE